MTNNKFEYETVHQAAHDAVEAIQSDVGGLTETQVGVYAHVAARLMVEAAHQGAEDYLNDRPDPLSWRDSTSLYLALASGTTIEKKIEAALGAQAMGDRGAGTRIASWVHDYYRQGRTAAGEQMPIPAA